jgi:transcriptional regulator with XRE-family HTH domain
LRVDAQLQQKDIAARADLSLGTISAIETNKRPVLQESLEKYAEVFKTSVFELLHADDPPPTDPLWTGLNRDHLQIAHKFKDGLTKPRRAVEILLNEPQGEAVAELVLATQDVPIAAVLALLELWAQKLEPALEGQWTRTLAPGELFAVLAKLAETDPVFLALLRDTIRDPELREETRRFIEEKTKK